MAKRVIAAVTGVGRFVYSFIFGDDWTVALAILAGLAATALLVRSGINAWWVVPLLAVAMTGFSLRRRTRAPSPR